MQTKYDDELEIRPDEIDGEKDWFWIKDDHGSWDGPKEDWISSHSKRYFKNVRAYNCVITAGANNGMYSRLYSKLFKVVYAFEPNPQTFHTLVRNCQVPNVVKFNCALGAVPQLVSVEGSNDNTGMFTIKEGVGLIPMLTIDSLGLPGVDLLQLDVEGYECQCLMGGINTIVEHKPVIVCERGRNTDLQKFIRELGYDEQEDSVSDTIFVHKDRIIVKG